MLERVHQVASEVEVVATFWMICLAVVAVAVAVVEQEAVAPDQKLHVQPLMEMRLSLLGVQFVVLHGMGVYP